MKETGKLTIGLGIICLFAATVLAVANLVTLGPRQRAKAQERQANLRLVLPDFRNDPTAETQEFSVTDRQGNDAGSVTFYVARDKAQDGEIIACAGEATTGQGFGGNVTVMAGLEPDGSILNVMVTNHSETPGLGTRVTDRSRTRYIWEAFSAAPEKGLPPSEYLDQYGGKTASEVGAKDFQVVTNKEQLGPSSVMAVSGATVSSRAVADAVNLICRAFKEHRGELMSP